MSIDSETQSIALTWWERESFLTCCREGKIPGIKEIRRISRIGLKEAKDTVEFFGAQNPDKVNWVPEEHHKTSPGFQLIFSGVIVEPGFMDEFHTVPSGETILLTSGSIMCYDVLKKEVWVTGTVSGADLRAMGIRLHNTCNAYDVPLEEIVVQFSP